MPDGGCSMMKNEKIRSILCSIVSRMHIPICDETDRPTDRQTNSNMYSGCGLPPTKHSSHRQLLLKRESLMILTKLITDFAIQRFIRCVFVVIFLPENSNDDTMTTL